MKLLYALHICIVGTENAGGTGQANVYIMHYQEKATDRKGLTREHHWMYDMEKASSTWRVFIKVQGKGRWFKIRYLYHIQQTIAFPGIGHTPLEQSHLPWENTAHVIKVCRQLKRLNFRPPGTHYYWVGKGSMEWLVCLTFLHMISSGHRTPNLFYLESNALSTRPNTHNIFVLMGESRPHGLVSISWIFTLRFIFIYLYMYVAVMKMFTNSSMPYCIAMVKMFLRCFFTNEKNHYHIHNVEIWRHCIECDDLD